MHRNSRISAGLTLSALLLCGTAGSAATQEEKPAPPKPPAIQPVPSWTQFLQGNADGGLETGWEYGGKVELSLIFDTQGLKLWPGGKLLAKGALRYGNTVDPLTGAVLPASTALIDPREDGTVFSITAFNFTQTIPRRGTGNFLILSLGRFALLDMITEPFIGGNGTDRWMYLGHIAPPHEGRNIPLITAGGTVALVNAGEPIFSFSVFDPQSSPTRSGLDRLFARGVTLYPSLTLPVRMFGRTGHHGIRASWSNQDITPFDDLPQFLLPPPERDIDPESGSWSFTYSANQYVAEAMTETGQRTGWGLFWQFGLAEERTNPFGWFANVGVGGSSPIRGRPMDYFGLAYSYTGLSDVLTEVVDPLVSLRDEQNVEVFYRYAITPWAQVTADVQVIRPIRPRAETAFVPGIRLKLGL